MLHDNNLIEKFQSHYSEKYENYPVLEKDLGQETIYDYKGTYH